MAIRKRMKISGELHAAWLFQLQDPDRRLRRKPSFLIRVVKYWNRLPTSHFQRQLDLAWEKLFKLGRHAWFALRCLFTNSRNSAFTVGFWNIVLKATSKRTEELRTGKWKVDYMENCGSETPQPANKFKMAANGWNYRRPNYPLMWPRIVLS